MSYRLELEENSVEIDPKIESEVLLSQEQARSFKELTRRILEMNRRVRAHGLPAVRESIQVAPDSYPFIFKLGIKLGLAGIDPGDVRTILLGHIFSGELSGPHFHESVLAQEGVYSILSFDSIESLKDRFEELFAEDELEPGEYLDTIICPSSVRLLYDWIEFENQLSGPGAAEENLEEHGELVYLYMNLAKIVRLEGLRGLARRIKHPRIPLELRQNLEGILERKGPGDLREEHEERIWEGEFTSAEMRSELIRLEGTSALLYGESPRLVFERLAAFFGEAGYFPLKESLRDRGVS